MPIPVNGADSDPCPPAGMLVEPPTALISKLALTWKMPNDNSVVHWFRIEIMKSPPEEPVGGELGAGAAAAGAPEGD